LYVATTFVNWLEACRHSGDARDVVRVDVENYLLDIRERTTAANESKHYRSLQQFWRWLVDVEEELPASPMAKMQPPRVPLKPVPVLPDDAITRLLLDTGMRAGELLGLTIDGVDELGRPTGLDWRYEVAHVIGKGDRHRACP